MRAGHQHSYGRGNEISIYVIGVNRHIGAVFPIEDQRKGLPVLDAEENEAGEAAGIDADMADIDTFGRQ